MDQIEDGLEYRRRFGLEDLWGSMEAIYYNVHESMSNDGPNIFLSQGDSMLSTLTVPAPRIKVEPLSPESVDRAPLVQAIDNTLLDDLDVPLECERAALHAYLFSTGFIKIGYDSEWGYDPTLDIGGSLSLGMTTSQFNASGTRRLEHDSGVVPGMPWVRAVMPHDLVVPWGTRDLRNAPWIAHRVVRHIEDVKADKKYKNTRRLVAQISMEDFVHSYRSTVRMRHKRGSSRFADYIELWEIHDRRTGRIYVVVQGHDKFLRRDRNLLQVNNTLPFASIGFTPTTRALWSTPDVHYLLHIQQELSDVAVQRTKQRRIATLKFLYDNDVIDDQEMAKLMSPEVGIAAKIKGGRNLQEAILKLDNVVNQTLTLEEDHLRQNAREQIGFSRNQLGEFTGGRKTATEVGAVERSSQLRMSRRGLAMKRLYEDTMNVVNGLIFSLWTLPRYVQVLDEVQARRWQQVSGPGIQGRYRLKATLVDDAAEQARGFEALQLYGLLSQDPTIDPVALRTYLADEVGDPRFERLFNADIQSAMSQLRALGGGVLQTNAQPRRAAQLQSVRGGTQNGTPSSNGQQRLLA